jgi:hypothetical protein
MRLVGGRVFHPGDALTVPAVPVETLLVPLHAPWNKVGELIDYVREVGPARMFGVHDVLLSQLGLGIGPYWLGGESGVSCGVDYEELAVGASVELTARG